MADLKISALTASTTPLTGTEVLPIVQSGTTKQVSVANLTAGRGVTASSLTVGTTKVYDLTFAIAGNAGFPKQASGSSYPFGFDHEATAYGQMRLMSSTTSSNTLNKTIMAFNQGGDVTVNLGNLVIGTSGKGIDFSANTNAAGMTSEVLTWYEEGTWTPTIAGQITAGTGTYTTQVGRYTRIGRVVYVSLNLAWSAHTGTGDMQVNGLPFTVNSSVTSQMSNGTYDLALTALNMLLARAQTSGTFIKLLQSPVGGGAWNGVPMDTSVTVLEITGFYTV